MVEKRRGLGRGLGALISSAPVAEVDPTQTPKPEQAEARRPPKDGNQTPEASSSSPQGEVSRETVATGSDKIGQDSPAQTSSKEKAGSAATSRKQSKKPRPVDMFFSSGDPNEEADDESPAGSRRSKGAGRAGRSAMPDVLGQVRQRRDDDTTQPPDAATPEASPSRPLEPSSAAHADDPDYAPDESGDAVLAEVPRETLVQVPGAEFAELQIEDIHPNRRQPRTVFDEDEMAELVHSIKEVGLLQPIVVRPSDEGSQKYELVMGERRWRAVQLAGLPSIPAIVRQTPDTDLLRDALLENLHRSQLNPLEEAAAYQQLMQEFDCTQEELSDRIGRSRPQISNTIRLMKLPALVQRRVAAGVLSAGHARALLGLTDAGEMERLAQRIVNEGLSVRATEEIVSLNDGLRRPSREKSSRTAARHERLDYLASSLSDHLDTTVKITLGARKGRVSIEFGSVDDLNRIMGVIAPPSNE